MADLSDTRETSLRIFSNERNIKRKRDYRRAIRENIHVIKYARHF